MMSLIMQSSPASRPFLSLRSKYSPQQFSVYSPNIVRAIKSRRMRWTGHVVRMGERKGVYRVLVGRPEGKRPLEIPSRMWEDNIKMDLREIRIDGANWIQLAQDRVQWRAFVSTVTISFSNNILHHGVSK
jgi:hypothetical protein